MVALLNKGLKLEAAGEFDSETKTGITVEFGPGRVRLTLGAHVGYKWLFLEKTNLGFPLQVWRCLASAGLVTFSNQIAWA